MTRTDDTQPRTAHTPEPWEVSENPLAGYGDNGPNFWITAADKTIAILPTYVRVPDDGHTDQYLKADANARRICAAVNACQGISTDALENGVVKELLASSIKFSEALRTNYSDAQLCLEERDAWRDAIEKVTGRTA